MICTYAPQVGLPAFEKDVFYEQLLGLISTISDSEYLVIVGDFNGHVGKE